MSDYFRRVSEKIAKLPSEQVKEFLEDVCSENEIFDSVLESLSTGLVIVDKDWKLILTNKAAERYVPFSIRPDDAKAESVLLPRLVDNAEIADFLNDCREHNRSNVSDEFTTETAGGSVRFITLTVLPLVKKREVSGSIVTVRDITASTIPEDFLQKKPHRAWEIRRN